VDEVNIIFDTKKYCTFFAIKNLNNSPIKEGSNKSIHGDQHYTTNIQMY